MAAMQQIADWLKTLGMSEYAQRFADNDVDTSVVRHLTDQDLRELGVSLGHRRKMLAAIASLDDKPAAAERAPALAHASPHTPAIARAGCASCWRAPACDGHVLRSRGFDRDFGEARRRGMARSCRRLSGCRFGGGDGNGRPCRQEARRRADGAVRLSGGAGERCRTRSARCARNPARAG